MERASHQETTFLKNVQTPQDTCIGCVLVLACIPFCKKSMAYAEYDN